MQSAASLQMQTEAELDLFNLWMAVYWTSNFILNCIATCNFYRIKSRKQVLKEKVERALVRLLRMTHYLKFSARIKSEFVELVLMCLKSN